MREVKTTTFNAKNIEQCKNCKGTGKIEQRGYDYGHGHAAEPHTIVCPTCDGEGRIIVHTKGVKSIIALIHDEWQNIRPADIKSDEFKTTGESLQSTDVKRSKWFNLFNRLNIKH